MERRLAAILVADVVSYTRLMEWDEVGVFTRLRAHREHLFKPEVSAHRGRIFKLMGDGFMAEFPSAVDAVTCAVALQHEIGAREAALSEDRRIRIRIAVHLGSIIIDGDDCFGKDVNIAARLEQLADPGGVGVSATVHRDIRDKLDLGFESLGEQRLKNLDEEVTLFRVLFNGGPSLERSSRTGMVKEPTIGRGGSHSPKLLCA